MFGWSDISTARFNLTRVRLKLSSSATDSFHDLSFNLTRVRLKRFERPWHNDPEAVASTSQEFV